MPTLVGMPYPIFFDTNGEPLDSGYIYIGVAGLNPLTNPLTIYWDSALTIPAIGIRTIHGFPSYSGAPGVLFVNSAYSILVKNKLGAVVFSNLNAIDFSTASKKIFGEYDIETVTIPGGTDKKLMFTNKQTGKVFTITETRSPAGVVAEATHSLGAVADGIDYVFDFSLNNYDAEPKGMFVLSAFNDDDKLPIYWLFKRRPTGQTGYGAMELYFMMKLDETNGLQVNAAKSEGSTPTWVKVLTESDRASIVAVHGQQAFFVSGTLVIPTGVTNVHVTGCAAGGNGADYGVDPFGGGGGGGGAWTLKQFLTVVPGATLTITIGGNSAATTIKRDVTTILSLSCGVNAVAGAVAGAGGAGGALVGGTMAGGAGGSGGHQGVSAFSPAGCGNSAGGGGGGGGSYCAGSSGAYGSNASKGGYGGGGGGGSSGSGSGAFAAGAGGPAFLIIEW